MAQKTLIKDDFRFSLNEDFLGYNSASDPTRLDPRYMTRGSKNVYKNLRGNIASRPGLKRRGEIDSTEAGTKSSFEWETSLGTFHALRVVDGRLEVESDILDEGSFVWYELLLTSTLGSLPTDDLTRFVFDAWWYEDDAADRLLFVRGDSNLFYWSGGMAVISSAAATTLTKTGTETWAEAGFAITTSGEKKIMVDLGGGDVREITYTGGTDSTTLTGCSISSGAMTDLTANSIAIQSVISKAGGVGDMFPATFNADFIKVVENQVYAGSYTSRAVYSSGNEDFLDFVNSGSHVYGDPAITVLDSPCRGFGVANDGKFVIFGGDSDLYLVSLNENVNVSYTGQDSQAVFNFNKVVKKKLPSGQAALGHEFIDNFGEYLTWLDQKNQLRALGTFSNSLTQKPAHLSLQVQEELSQDDFTGGHLRAIEDTIYITAPNNGRDWMYQVRERINDNGEVVAEKLWQPPQIRGISRFAVIDGVLHGHSNVNPQLYQIWDTEQWYDDHPSDEPIPYTCVARFAYRQLSELVGTIVLTRRQGMLTFDKLFFEGYMSDFLLSCNIYYDYQGAKNLLTFPIHDPEDEGEQAKFFIGNSAPSFGGSSLGDNPLGDGILPEGSSQELVPKFRRITDVNNINCFEYCLEIFSTEPDSRWEILAFGPNVARASAQPVHLRG